MNTKTIYAMVLSVIAWAIFLPGSAYADSGRLESYKSLASPPKGGDLPPVFALCS